MLQILVLTGWLVKASISQITSHGNETAAYGGDAHYGCAVSNLTGVLQVTWQRLFKDETMENLATYSERFGQQVNEPHRGKVAFTEASLSSSTIALSHVTWGDDGCYICTFNAYPEGSKWKQTCLTVQGISEVTTGVHAPTSGHGEGATAEVVFSCSATGKPAPTIKWACSPGASSSIQPQTSTVTNSDQTFTSSGNITLQVPAAWRGYVDCLLNTGMMGQRRERIPLTLDRGNWKEEEEEGTSWPSGVVFVVLAALLILCVPFVAVLIRKRLKGNPRDENI